MAKSSTTDTADEWGVFLEAGNRTFPEAFTVPGPRRIQALNQAWKKVPEFLEENDINIPEREVDITLFDTSILEP